MRHRITIRIFEGHMETNTTTKKRDRYRDERNVGVQQISSISVYQRALLDHMRLRMEPLHYFSMPRESFFEATTIRGIHGRASNEEGSPGRCR